MVCVASLGCKHVGSLLLFRATTDTHHEAAANTHIIKKAAAGRPHRASPCTHALAQNDQSPPGCHFQRPRLGPRRARQMAVQALPTEALVAVVVIATGAAAAGLAFSSKDKIREGLKLDKPRCEACEGSGICPECKGEGFVNRNLNEAAAERARSKAPTAATRYTSGLAKKWKYCLTCNGARGCPSCEGRGWIDS
eukprot:jgi/Mesen1/9795/ME000007S09845